MKHYIVIPLYVSGKGKKSYTSGDRVSEDCFPPGNADKLCEQGFLKLDESKDTTPAPEKEVVETNFDGPTKNYTVIALTVAGSEGKVFNHGDKVTDKDFAEGEADAFVESGSLKLDDGSAATGDDELTVLQTECLTKEIYFDLTDDADELKAKLAKYQYNIDFANAKALCLSAGIAFDESADLETLKGLLQAIETESKNTVDTELEKAKAICLEKGIEFAADANLETLQGLIADAENEALIAAFTGKEFTNEKGKKKFAKKIEDITFIELKAELKKANAEFDTQSPKFDLFIQWIKL